MTDDAFGWQVDYAMLVKIYGAPREGEQRYSPCECLGAKVVRISGRPERRHISTSHIERSNLSMREAGLADHVWELEELVGLLDQRESN